LEVLVGPACEVLLVNDDGPTLDSIDALLGSLADRIDRTRKGRVWDVWIRGRPVHVQIVDAVLVLSAGGNKPEDMTVLRELADRIVQTVGGMYSEPEK
jgi:hypothetical protein